MSKLTYTFSSNANILSVSAASDPPGGGGGGAGGCGPPPPAGNTLNGKLAESTLALAENVYVVLPAPLKEYLQVWP